MRHEMVFDGFSRLMPVDRLRLTSPQLIGQDAFTGHFDKIEGEEGYYTLLFGKTDDVGKGVVQVFGIDEDDIDANPDDYNYAFPVLL